MEDPKTKTIKLLDPVLWGEGRVREIKLREPRWTDVEALGYPSEVMQSGETLSLATYPSIVAQYADRCFQPRGEGHVLQALSLRDTLSIHEAVLDFFREARAEMGRNSGESSPAASSSTSASA